MKRLTSSLVLLAAFAASGAMAQSSSIFGGFSYLRGTSDLFPIETDTPTLLGWQASYTHRIAPRFGLTGEFAGNYGPVSRSGAPYYGFSTPTYMQHSVLGGPEATVLKLGRFSVNLRALAGIARANDPYLQTMSGYFFRRGESGATAFAAAVGGSADVALTPRVSLRVLQPEYFLTRFDNSFQSNLRVSTGVVFRFGR